MASIHDPNNAHPFPVSMEGTSEPEPGATVTSTHTQPAPPVLPSENDKEHAPSPPHSSLEGGSESPTQEKENKDGEKEYVPLGERSRGKIMLVMLALMLAVFLAAIDITIITTALPTISEYFNSSAGYTWIGSAYLLAAAASTPVWGKVSDIFGRKPTLLVANFVFFIGSLFAGLANSIGMLIAARAIQGIGGGGLIVLVNICIGDLFSQRRRGAYYGMIGGVWALASSLGPIVGGAFTEKVTWRWCFYINLPVDGLAFTIIFFFLDVRTPKTPFLEGIKAIDWLGSLLVVGGTLMFLFGIEYGGVTYPWDSATVICLIVFGIVTIGLFVLVQAKLSKYPVMPLRIFRYRSNIASLGVCFCHGYVFIGGAYYLPLYFQAALGATPILSGVYVLAQSVSLSFSSIATGIFIRKTGLYLPPIIAGYVLMTIGFGLYIDLDANSSWAKIFLYQIVAGIGVGPNFQAPLIALQTLVAPRDIGTATSTFGFTRNIATSISVVVGGVIFQNEMEKKGQYLARKLGPAAASQLGGGNAGANVMVIDKLPLRQENIAQDAFASSLKPVWIMYVCFSAVGLLISLLITKQGLKKEHEETKTGLEAEEQNRLEAKEQKDLRKAEKERRRTAQIVAQPNGGAEGGNKETDAV